MIKINRHRLEWLMDNMAETKIAVVGDLMVDQYLWGKTNRISPEAPVPVVDIYKEEAKPGGAANVALNLQSLFINTDVYGVLGLDSFGDKLLDEFKELNINTEGIVRENFRPTTVKTRILASGQHVVRYDNELSEPLNEQSEKKLISQIEENIDEYSAIILEDYNKGVLTASVISQIIELANSKGVITAIDPKLKNYECYKGATIFKPNLREAEDILKRKITSDKEIEQAGKDLLEKLGVKYLLITLSEKGMALFSNKKPMKLIPAKTTKIANVSGAGDTVIATLTAALSVNAQIEEACTLANYAASVVVENVNIIPITRNSLFRRLVESDVVINE